MIAPVLDERGTVTHFLRLAEDVTEQKRAQAAQDALHTQRRQVARVASVGRLAGGVAHDFSNLLTVVAGHAHLVREQLPPHDPLREDLDAILAAASRGATITRQLLTYAHREVVHPLALDPAHAIAALARLLQRLAGDEIRLGFSLGPDIWPIRIDPSQLDEMVVHLVTNARDAIGGHGAIDLSLSNLQLASAATASHGDLPAGDYVALRVSDTGGGIPPAALPHIFEPFFSTKPPGSGAGLGLSSVVGTVEHAGGHVQVERTGADGTTFLVLLPRSARPAEGPRGGASTLLEGTERILLVEDEPAVPRTHAPDAGVLRVHRAAREHTGPRRARHAGPRGASRSAADRRRDARHERAGTGDAPAWPRSRAARVVHVGVRQ